MAFSFQTVGQQPERPLYMIIVSFFFAWFFLIISKSGPFPFSMRKFLASLLIFKRKFLMSFQKIQNRLLILLRCKGTGRICLLYTSDAADE